MGYNTSLPQEAARTHNHSHLNLFLSFILRVVSVLVKDNVLYSSCSTLHCPDQQSSWVGCKLSLVLFQDCIMSSFYWLLAEGLHLHALLVAMLPGRCFTAYLLIGWETVSPKKDDLNISKELV
ncbi:Vasoactive Intestinal Polypeptide Receptor 2 [Manis pentadactyla]|nr:Vasoactive Intestinal Polypeptide Receptor 2 [Manis pentadactyla]